MKRTYIVLPLLLSAFLFSGCLNFLIKYVIEKDGSARLITRIEIDTALLNGMNSFANSPMLASGKGKHAKPRKTKKENIEQSIIDSVRGAMSTKQFKQTEGLSYVKKTEITAIPTDSSLIITATIALRSYRDIDSLAEHVAALDTTQSQAQLNRVKHPAIIVEHGDSIEFNPRWDDALSGSGDVSKLGSPNDSSAAANPSDSTTGQIAQMGQMLAKMISMKLVVEVPNILSYDTNGVYDRRSSSVTWSSEKMSEMTNPPSKLSGHLVFRKP